MPGRRMITMLSIVLLVVLMLALSFGVLDSTMWF